MAETFSSSSSSFLFPFTCFDEHSSHDPILILRFVNRRAARKSIDNENFMKPREFVSREDRLARVSFSSVREGRQI